MKDVQSLRSFHVISFFGKALGFAFIFSILACHDTGIENNPLIKELEERWIGSYEGMQICTEVTPGYPTIYDTTLNVVYKINGFTLDENQSLIHVDIERNEVPLDGYFAQEQSFLKDSVDLVKIFEHNYYSIKLFQSNNTIKTYSNKNLIPFGGSSLTCNGFFERQ